jgi:hypothetical protein
MICGGFERIVSPGIEHPAPAERVDGIPPAHLMAVNEMFRLRSGQADKREDESDDGEHRGHAGLEDPMWENPWEAASVERQE